MNLAAPMAELFSSAQSTHHRRLRFNPLRSLTGQSLATALDGFEAGDLRAAALLWQSMWGRDDILSVVKPKREKAVSRRDWTVLTSDDSGAAKAHAKTLTDFWNGITAVNAYDRNERGGMSRLIRQMMESASYKYAAHHIAWKPMAGKLTATFEYVPLWFFENRTGELRFVSDGMGYAGVEMPRNEWMVTVGDGLMIAASIGYFAKRSALADWITFSQDFGQPKVVGRTGQSADSPGGEAMADAVAQFGNDWRTVIFGDDGSGKIELLTVNGSASLLPMPALIERVDRRMTALYRGADLSTMSSSQGQGTGASVQEGETDIIEFDDALTISETLNEVERQVIAWHYGANVTPRAYIRLLVPQREDMKLLLESINTLVRLGAPFAVSEVLERFGWSQPKAGVELLSARAAAPVDPAAPDATTQTNGLSDAAEERFLAGAARLLARCPEEARAELTEGLKTVLKAPAGTELNALVEFIAELPEQIAKDGREAAEWRALLAGALTAGLNRR